MLGYAERLGRADGTEEVWRIVSSRGCCAFTVHLVSGVAVIEGAGWCLACVREAQDFARNRGYRMQRLVALETAEHLP